MAKKTKIIVLVVFITVVVAVSLGLGLGLTLKLAIPKPEVIEVTGEPDYTIKIGWEKVIAKQYIIKYRYRDVYGEKYRYETTDDNFIVIKRVKGNLDFSVQALNTRDIQTSKFSKESTYNVESLKLPSLSGFGFKELSGGRGMVDDYFQPVKYVYKGEERTVEFYEFVDNHNPDDVEILSYGELIDFVFNFPEGETLVKFRPVTYGEFGGTIIEIEDRIELKELYENSTTYVTAKFINPD